MPSRIRCPNCNSEELIDYGDIIECIHCGYEFFKEFLNSEIDEENILSSQELEGFTKTFQDEFKTKKERKKFNKLIEKNRQNLRD